MTIESFRAAVRRGGLDYAGPIFADGNLHRFKAAGDREKNSWYVLHAGPPAAGVFGCWKRGIREPWCGANGELSKDEWNFVRQRWQEAEHLGERHAKAKQIAGYILSRAAPVSGAHTYLARKGVKAFGGIREYRGALVLPLRDANGELNSLQFISAEGEKRFLTGGRITGCFFPLADKPDGTLVICEGYATGASIQDATGFVVVCAMNCGNLSAVAQALRAKWPEREVIIAADNDQFTEGNPGLTKATEAAKAIGARLAFPQFADITTRPTDFNDLIQLEGPVTVKRQFGNAEAPKETETEAFERLAKLSPVDYDRSRQNEASKLGIRVGTLDTEVASRGAKRTGAGLQGSAPDLSDVEPWPEPVDGAQVLDEIAETFSRFVVLPDGAADVLALYCAHTHSFKSCLCSPRLNLYSVEKRCGKTTCRDVLALFVSRPLATENMSVAVLFRLVEAKAPTILADECDAWLQDNEELRGLLNAGHRRGGAVYRCEGDNHEVRGFNVFAPAVLCGIGFLPGTLHDRSVAIRLDRAKQGELRERFDSRHTERQQELRRKLARFCADNMIQLENSDPTLPLSAFNRVADNWRPLFAIAEVAGGNWPQRAAAAFAMLTGRDDEDVQGTGVMLLADTKRLFAESGVTRLPSAELCQKLAGMEEQPWVDYGRRGEPINANQLARLLRQFKIRPRNVKFPLGEVRKGYDLEDFQEAFTRYLPQEGDSGALPRYGPCKH